MVLNMLDFVMAIETGLGEISKEDFRDTLQAMINDGSIWKLQGSYGRMASAAIEAGIVTLPEESGTRDYYGSRIPSRDEVVPGTKGSQAYADWKQNPLSRDE